ncbi:hypothetical protein SUGI_0818360, partial [Cryptomeria japonica]
CRGSGRVDSVGLGAAGGVVVLRGSLEGLRLHGGGALVARGWRFSGAGVGFWWLVGGVPAGGDSRVSRGLGEPAGFVLRWCSGKVVSQAPSCFEQPFGGWFFFIGILILFLRSDVKFRW